MKNILCYGDSNTWGHNPYEFDSEKGCYVRYAADVRWTGIMQSVLGQEYRVYEEGLCGRTMAFDDPSCPGRNGVEYLEVAIRTCDPVDCVVLMLGTNDTKCFFNAPVDMLTQCAFRIVRQCKSILANTLSTNAKLVLVCPVKTNVKNEGEFSAVSARKGEDLRIALKEVARQEGCVYFDANTVAKASDADGIHMDASSHECFGQAMAALIRQILK